MFNTVFNFGCNCVTELQRKIARRSREFEQGITAEYPGQLNVLEESWITG